MQKADSLFSKMIRERDGHCVNCGSTHFLQCAHIITRSYKSIRTDEDNAVALCRSCHTYYTHRPLEWMDFIEETYPGRIRALREKALTYQKVDWKKEVERLK